MFHEMADTSMNASSNATNLLHPLVLWAQRKDRLFLTIQLEGCQKPTIDLKNNSLYFKGKGGFNHRDHECHLIFNKEVDPDTSKCSVHGREIFFCIMKKEDSHGFWPRLLKGSEKVHYVKTDFNRWKDEDDSDIEDEQEDFNLDEMMQSMGGFQGAGGGVGDQEDQEDSDDEELPDLQN